MPFYETVFIARQDIAVPQVEALTDTVKSIITDQGGSVAKVEQWGLRTLAYRVKKNRKGHYILMNIDAPSAAITEMERQMRINEDVLRYLTIRVDEFEEEPSVMMRSRGSDDRPRRGPRDENSFDNSNSRDDAPAPTPAAPAPVVEAAVEETPAEGAEA
ncbi:MAG: 30S ribosomal protein S6 [Rhodospirillales bacterium]|nr:30S ribosomal protein S6 [Rhodospirillales bacterium]